MIVPPTVWDAHDTGAVARANVVPVRVETREGEAGVHVEHGDELEFVGKPDHAPEQHPVRRVRIERPEVIRGDHSLAQLLHVRPLHHRAELRLPDEEALQMRVLSAEGKLSAIVLVAVPFFITAVLSVLRPEYIGILLTDAIGRVMVVTALIMMGCGIYVMKNMVSLKV